MLAAMRRASSRLLQPRHASLRRPAQQLRQLGDVGGDAPGGVAAQPGGAICRGIGRSGSARLALETTLITRVGSLTVLSFDEAGSIPESELVEGSGELFERRHGQSGLGHNILEKCPCPFHPICKKSERIPEVRKTRNLLRLQLFW
jgi:hypothetical protein